MQNHNAKIKNSTYRPIRSESAENPGAPGNIFMQNKANLRKAQMNAKSITTREYEEKRLFWLEKNKANLLAFSVLRSADWVKMRKRNLKKQSQFMKGQSDAKSVMTMIYGYFNGRRLRNNKAKTNPNSPATKGIKQRSNDDGRLVPGQSETSRGRIFMDFYGNCRLWYWPVEENSVNYRNYVIFAPKRLAIKCLFDAWFRVGFLRI